ncbi:MAG: hypothetical protein QGG71_02980 [Pirellulaceae bacterium]|jgi:hypothetical protein|nr:hypothetical protein [Pirellulaceae bacterium]
MFRFPCRFPLAILLGAVIFTGCGATKSRIATEQLLVSDAVDYAVSSIDFRTLAGRKVFLDSKYIRNVKSAGFVNADYIISSLRQQMIGADCWLVENHEAAEVIVEARVGTLGSDGNEVSFGIPASNALSTAATLVPGAPVIPTIPEISFARKEGHVGAVKIAVFAFERETGHPIWQSGIARARSTSQDFWLFGAGPFQNGSIHKGTRFAGETLRIPVLGSDNVRHTRSAVAYDIQHIFPDPDAEKQDILQADYHSEDPMESGNNVEAKPIQLWGVGSNIATPLEADLERRLGEAP